jgi:hypothetical protein
VISGFAACHLGSRDWGLYLGDMQPDIDQSTQSLHRQLLFACECKSLECFLLSHNQSLYAHYSALISASSTAPFSHLYFRDLWWEYYEISHITAGRPNSVNTVYLIPLHIFLYYENGGISFQYPFVQNYSFGRCFLWLRKLVSQEYKWRIQIYGVWEQDAEENIWS